MPGAQIDTLMDLWAASLLQHDDQPPFSDHGDLYNTIDTIPHGDVAWESFLASYQGPRPEGDVPAWMDRTYDVWFRDPRNVIQHLLKNSSFSGEFDYAPSQQFDGDGERQYQDFMSGDWAWQQAVSLFFPSQVES
jgi:hypothetical protein